jgi:hypothetical protein
MRPPPRRKRGVQRGSQASGIGQRQQLGEHRAGVPVHVPPAAFPVTPAGAPRHAGDDHRRGAPARRRAHPHQRMLQRVIPVHPRRQHHAVRHRDVHLQGEPAARRPGGTERLDPEGQFHGAHHSSGQEQQPGKLPQVKLLRRTPCRARQHIDRRRGRPRQLPRQQKPGQRLRVPLEEPRQPGRVVDLKILQHSGIAGRCGPVPARFIGRQPVQHLRCGLPVRSLAHANRRYVLDRAPGQPRESPVT